MIRELGSLLFIVRHQKFNHMSKFLPHKELHFTISEVFTNSEVLHFTITPQDFNGLLFERKEYTTCVRSPK